MDTKLAKFAVVWAGIVAGAYLISFVDDGPTLKVVSGFVGRVPDPVWLILHAGWVVMVYQACALSVPCWGRCHMPVLAAISMMATGCFAFAGTLRIAIYIATLPILVAYMSPRTDEIDAVVVPHFQTPGGWQHGELNPHAPDAESLYSDNIDDSGSARFAEKPVPAAIWLGRKVRLECGCPTSTPANLAIVTQKICAWMAEFRASDAGRNLRDRDANEIVHYARLLAFVPSPAEVRALRLASSVPAQTMRELAKAPHYQYFRRGTCVSLESSDMQALN